MKERPQLGIKDAPLIFAIVLFSFAIHEFAHWFCGESMGYDLFVGINKAGLANGEYTKDWHKQLVSAAGPFVTIIVALTGLWLVYRYKLVRVFPIVFFSAMMRASATMVSMWHPNDEARISEWLGIGKWTLPLLVTISLGWVTILAGEKLGLNIKSWLICFVFCSIGVAVIVLTEPSWPVINPYED